MYYFCYSHRYWNGSKSLHRHSKFQSKFKEKNNFDPALNENLLIKTIIVITSSTSKHPVFVLCIEFIANFEGKRGFHFMTLKPNISLPFSL